MTIPQQVRRGITIWPSNSVLGYIPQRMENKCLNQSMYMNVYSCVTHNNQKVETTQMSVNEWMDKQM